MSNININKGTNMYEMKTTADSVYLRNGSRQWARPVVTDLGSFYASQKDAADKLGVNFSAVSKSMRDGMLCQGRKFRAATAKDVHEHLGTDVKIYVDNADPAKSTDKKMTAKPKEKIEKIGGKWLYMVDGKATIMRRVQRRGALWTQTVTDGVTVFPSLTSHRKATHTNWKKSMELVKTGGLRAASEADVLKAFPQATKVIGALPELNTRYDLQVSKKSSKSAAEPASKKTPKKTGKHVAKLNHVFVGFELPGGPAFVGIPGRPDWSMTRKSKDDFPVEIRDNCYWGK